MLPPVTEFDVAQAVGLMVTQPVDAYFPALIQIKWLKLLVEQHNKELYQLHMMAAPAFNDAFVAEGFALATIV